MISSALSALRRCWAEHFFEALTEFPGPDAFFGQRSALSFIANRSSFLIGELLLGNLSETVVVVGNAPHDRPGLVVGHLIGNRASFLCTKAPMRRIPETNFWARCSGDLPPSPPASILRHNAVNR